MSQGISNRMGIWTSNDVLGRHYRRVSKEIKVGLPRVPRIRLRLRLGLWAQ